jgi:type I restriction enzyme S subunit
LSRANLQSIKILVPPIFCQQHLEQQLAQFVQRQVSIAGENDSLKNLRDTLLPKLLSGQLRIPEAEQQVADMP